MQHGGSESVCVGVAPAVCVDVNNLPACGDPERWRRSSRQSDFLADFIGDRRRPLSPRCARSSELINGRGEPGLKKISGIKNLMGLCLRRIHK